MKSKSLFLLLSFTFVAHFALASTGTIDVRVAKNRPNTLDVRITGAAASDISAQLSANGITMVRDPFSGAMVQMGSGIRCIDGDHGKPLYCYIAVVGASIQ